VTPVRWIVLGVLAALLVLVQAQCLDESREIRAERVYTNVADVPPGDVLPTYIASLFFGSFRAVAIDFLWIQLKRIEDEKRWYERREILRLISYFQPRNRAVWAMLGWHSAYNVANSFSDPERSWEWVRFGIEWLRRGVRQIPDDPSLKYELAWTLQHKPSWKEGWIDLPLLARIEADRELQEMLQDRRPIDRPRSSFELAIEWYAKSRSELITRKDWYQTTQMGLNIFAQTTDSLARECMYLQGMYDWRMGRTESAKEWFLKAADQAKMILDTYPHVSFIFKDYERFCRGLPRVVDLEVRARSGRPEDERAYLEALQKVVVEDGGEFGVPDRDFLWGDGNPNAPLNRLKQKLAGGRDPQECNDAIKMATYVPEGQLLMADLSPEGMDVDFYKVLLAPPKGPQGEPVPKRPPSPVRMTFRIKRPQGAGLDLRITVMNGVREKVREAVSRASADEAAVEFDAADYGGYFLKVEAAEEIRPWPKDTRYFLMVQAGR
jgi:tetratricopeptide (TPR) repeat protein